ncbi:alpha-amylase family glycosyl hydrolase [Sphingomicrobium sp. XHP0239]|uniref:alpha-amylase family glycosyl hydrolase n=1 Tax=Sphingomicrobium maritimum TaxID=3133972 RepID=UPI0031CCD648
MVLSLLAASIAAAQPAPAATAPADYLQRRPEDEIIYFVLPDRFDNGDPSNDRGGIAGGRLDHGYDPTARGFYHGGDLAGLTQRLDYLQGMGITAIWFAPIFKNKPVQGPSGDESSGYHGYWVTDFTRIDPHFGTNAEFEAFVDAAHGRGMKIYMDIITNHTADVIKHREDDYGYRSKADYPYSTRGGVDGERINIGFEGDNVRTVENFAKLTDPRFAYDVYVPEGERNVKVPAWLNDPIYYHNRGDTNFYGEDSLYGDFVGLDDLFTENPRVVGGMIDIFGSWIDRFAIDGFRIDTARHVNPEFWQTFVPAMEARSEAAGIPYFHMFGEVYRDTPDNGYIAQYTVRDGFPAVLDFAFQAAVREVLGRGAGTDVLAGLFAGDVLYRGGAEAAKALPTFLGNHDMGRFSGLLKADMPEIDQDELLARVALGHAMLMTLRGSPTIYYGDEQGFVSDGNDQLARENMFESRVSEYNDNDLIGTDATTAGDNFDPDHPLYRQVAALAAIRTGSAALRRGDQVTRHYQAEPGLFAVSRFDPETGAETLLMFNTSTEAIEGQVEIDMTSERFVARSGECATMPSAPGSLSYTMAPLSWAICEAQ